jgi:hypothetical protein
LFKRINDLTKNGQLNTRTFGSVSDVIDFYRKILGKAGTLRCIDACEEDNYVVKLETESGRSYYGLMRTKDVGDGQCKASITFSPHSSDDGETDVDPEDNEPTIDDDTTYEVQKEGRVIRMSPRELRGFVKESVKRIIKGRAI